MGKTPIRIESRHPGSDVTMVVDYSHADEGKLSISTIVLDGTTTIDVTISELVKKLAFIPGLTIKYEKPIVIPKYLGAVVRRDDGMGGREQWVRYLEDNESSLPWVDQNGNRRSNDDIAAVLANGAYEKQPQFPRNGERA